MHDRVIAQHASFRSEPHQAHVVMLCIQNALIGAAAGGPFFVKVIPEGHLVLISAQDCTKSASAAVEDGRLHVTGREILVPCSLQRNADGQAAMCTHIKGHRRHTKARPCSPSFMEIQKPVRLPAMTLLWIGRFSP